MVGNMGDIMLSNFNVLTERDGFIKSLSIPDADGYTALHLMVSSDQIELFKLSKEKGANTNIIIQGGITPDQLLSEKEKTDKPVEK
jgi:ankyrin repeat protein